MKRGLKLFSGIKLFITLSFLFFLTSINIPELNAQGTDFEKRMERLNAHKIAFFTQKLQLTSEEAEKFWPVYNSYQKEKTTNQKKKISLESKFRLEYDFLNEKEMEDMTDEYINYIKKDADLSTDYHQKFKKVLPINKVMTLYQAENQYKAMLLRQLRNQQQMNNKPRY